MLNFSKSIVFVLIWWSLLTCNAVLVSNLFNALTGLLFPKDIQNAKGNGKLCGLDTPGIATHYGYKNRKLNVITKDGYIITVYSIWNSTALNPSLNPVIAWHGLSAASNSLVLNYRNQSIADRGYKVFLPNSRGTGESQRYDPSILKNPYWKFSWDEIAEFDTPAVVDAVLEWTNKSKVIYIGHSQGNTAMFAFLSSKPEYNQKISVFAALAPVVYFSHTTSILFVLGNAALPVIEPILYGSEFLRRNYLETLLRYYVCTLPTQSLCDKLLFVLIGYSSRRNQVSRWKKRTETVKCICHAPANFAWGQYLHYAQLKGVDAFQKYDFGLANQDKYGQSTPPRYNVSNVSAPVALFRSGSDTVAADVDVQKLKSQLPNVIFDSYLNASYNFKHSHYIWGPKDVYELVYSDLINVIKNY